MRIAMILAAVGTTLSLMSVSLSASPGQPSSPLPTDQQRISVQVEGEGRDVILIPGLASSREVWADLATRLRQDHRLHLVQLAGFAGSPAVTDSEGKVLAPVAEAIADYIRTQHIEAPVIIGHSLGGEVALMLGARHPDQVGRLMIVDALPFYTLLIDPLATSETATVQAAAMRSSLLAASPEQSEAMQKASIARLAKTEAVRPGLVSAGISSDRKTVADAVYELMITDLRPELGRISAPVEVVYAYDAFYGVPASSVDATFRRAYASTPDIHFTRIDESFHFVMLDQPERFASAVAAFLEPGAECGQ
ncbi:alpha/beta fold hydrolase [Pseudomonas mosselii]|uniref:alpha/beta fold hydrolase n=1 Tax=Pseudomonas mosselii TaxID=78327 RepID=UPI001E2E945A|nr:alpha/beta hydrolase [Pseudomonas mosselii]MCL8300384.1 alpha/beta hydrolase [Pseudomonas mosselii]MCL8341209.1 alpha/beta hydrolase [Pseudomonas mosselii]MCU9528184.1 alpha/beta hydrolase [Pseudomonas mosselii]MCU9535290.1 alpha/beta hydrolase [Pseudomonas mosselii]MCU9540923.1 alpha/beta hydrolase [Pseudomonas mosselii]